MVLDAAFGRGCTHCEVGHPVEEIKSRAGHIHLCLECVLWWFPGKSVAWWEERHAPFADHLSDKIEEVLERMYQEALAARLREPVA